MSRARCGLSNTAKQLWERACSRRRQIRHRLNMFNDGRLKTLAVTSQRLRRLAPLPTRKTESAGLCVFGVGYIVSRLLKNSDRVW